MSASSRPAHRQRRLELHRRRPDRPGHHLERYNGDAVWSGGSSPRPSSPRSAAGLAPTPTAGTIASPTPRCSSSAPARPSLCRSPSPRPTTRAPSTMTTAEVVTLTITGTNDAPVLADDVSNLRHRRRPPTPGGAARRPSAPLIASGRSSHRPGPMGSYGTLTISNALGAWTYSASYGPQRAGRRHAPTPTRSTHGSDLRRLCALI